MLFVLGILFAFSVTYMIVSLVNLSASKKYITQSIISIILVICSSAGLILGLYHNAAPKFAVLEVSEVKAGSTIDVSELVSLKQNKKHATVSILSVSKVSDGSCTGITNYGDHIEIDSSVEGDDTLHIIVLINGKKLYKESGVYQTFDIPIK